MSGNVHLASNSVTVFTCSGQFVRTYDQSQLNSPRGIAIDSAGYSLVVNSNPVSLSIFNPSGTFIHLIGGFKKSFGVSVSPDESVWVADYGNNRLLKY